MRTSCEGASASASLSVMPDGTIWFTWKGFGCITVSIRLIKMEIPDETGLDVKNGDPAFDLLLRNRHATVRRSSGKAGKGAHHDIRLSTYMVGALVASFWWLCSSGFTQQASNSVASHPAPGACISLPPGGPTPRTADGHPDLSGVWFPNSAGIDMELAAASIPMPGVEFDPKVTPEEKPSSSALGCSPRSRRWVTRCACRVDRIVSLKAFPACS